MVQTLSLRCHEKADCFPYPKCSQKVSATNERAGIKNPGIFALGPECYLPGLFKEFPEIFTLWTYQSAVQCPVPELLIAGAAPADLVVFKRKD